MAFISSSNTNSGKSEVATVQGVSTTRVQPASVQVSTASTDVAAANLSYDTICAFIATQPNGSQIKYEDITLIDDDDIEEMDIKWNLALLSMRADRSPRSQDRGKKEIYKKDPRVEEPAPKAMIAIDGIGWDWSYMAEEDENHALVADEEEAPIEYARMAKSSSSSDNEIKFCERIRVLDRDLELRDNKIENLRNKLDEIKKEKESIDFKIEKFENASKNPDSLLGNQRLDIDKKGLRFNEYSAVPPPPAQVYSHPKKDLSWMGLPEFVDDTVTDYSRPTPSVDVFVKETGCPSVSKDNNTKNPRKPTVKYAEMYRNTSQSLKVRSNNFGPPVIEDWDSDDESEIESTTNKTDRPSIELGIPQDNIDDKGYWDSGCSRHMTGNISYLSEYEPYNGGYVSFGHGGGMITGKGTIKTGKLEFENVYFVKELKYNLFSVSQICDNKNSVLFTDSECLVLGKDFKLVDDTHVLLRTPRQQNMYSIDLKNIVPHKNLTCLIAKASEDESMLWHRRLGHLNFKTMNKLVRNNLVKGLPSKSFENNHTCVACLKGKQHKASCKSKLVNSVSKPLHTLHMDLFGPTSVSSLNHKWYCLVVTDDFSRFTWTFFLKSKDETFRILRNFITEIENLKDLKVKIIRCDNGGEFRNKEMDEFCSRKGIKREFSNARTPQQNGVAERRNRTLIKAARTVLADVKLPVTFWAEAVNTACYAQNRVLVIKPHNKTPYELFNERSLAIGFLRPFGCNIMILNTLDHLGTPSTNFSGIKEDANQVMKENVSSLRFIALPNWFHEDQMAASNDFTRNSDAVLEKDDSQKEQDRIISNADVSQSSGNTNPTAITKVPTADQVEPVLSSTMETEVPTVSSHVPPVSSSGPRIISRGLEDLFGDTTNTDSSNKVEADLSNMETDIQISPTPTLRIHKVHPKSQIIGPVDTPVQTRQKSKNMEEQSFIATIHQKTNPELLQYCLFSCFLSQEEPKKIFDALRDPSWVEAMQKELLQFKIQNVWVLVDCPNGVRPIGTKWVLKNKRYERGIVIRNKARLVAQGHTQEEGIDYKEVFAPVARIEAIRLFLVYASYMGFTVYQMDVKSVFIYGTIDEEHLKLDDIIFGSSNPRLCREFEALMHEKFKMSAMGELNFFLGLQVLKKKDGIFLLQDKYVVDILKKFGYTDIRSANTPIDRENPWGKDGTGKDVELHLYKFMKRDDVCLL
ncbi:putative ribonuclease H-like domain-containing protein [Tanacetum coccineum]